MKLYVIAPDSKKIYINVTANSRYELLEEIGGEYFSVNGVNYSVNDVYAEKGSDNTALGMVIGGALGLFGGTPGVLLGGAIGGALGKNSDDAESKAVRIFNSRKV